MYIYIYPIKKLLLYLNIFKTGDFPACHVSFTRGKKPPCPLILATLTGVGSLKTKHGIYTYVKGQVDVGPP